MKKLFIFAFAAIGLLACSEKNTPENGGEDQGGSTNPKEISCDPTIIEFDIAETITQTITLKVNGSWSATTNVDWITIDPTSGQGSSFVKITANKGKQAEGKVLFSTEKESAQVLVKRIDKYPGSFSVSENKKVYFSSGNLQHNASSNTWRFAEHQYDIIGADNQNVSPDYSGWIDLFGWGSSGYNGIYPWTYKYKNSSGETYDLYYAYKGDSDIAGTKYDWGEYNAISNGGNQAGLWRTLTVKEWRYIIDERVNASKLRGKASVVNINGALILPDGWTTPENVTFSTSNNNIYTLAEWQLMETSGAIFLPYAGFVNSNYDGQYVKDRGYYWTSTKATWPMHFNCSSFQIASDLAASNGLPVRLVKDVE